MAITEETEALMLAYVYGELSASDARSFEQRLDADPELRAEVEGLRATLDLLGRDAAFGESSGIDAPPAHLVDAIMNAEALERPAAIRQAALARATSSSPPPLTARLARWLLGGGLVVGAAATVFLVVSTGNRSPEATLGPAAAAPVAATPPSLLDAAEPVTGVASAAPADDGIDEEKGGARADEAEDKAAEKSAEKKAEAAPGAANGLFGELQPPRAGADAEKRPRADSLSPAGPVLQLGGAAPDAPAAPERAQREARREAAGMDAPEAASLEEERPAKADAKAEGRLAATSASADRDDADARALDSGATRGAARAKDQAAPARSGDARAFADAPSSPPPPPPAARPAPPTSTTVPAAPAPPEEPAPAPEPAPARDAKPASTADEFDRAPTVAPRDVLEKNRRALSAKKRTAKPKASEGTAEMERTRQVELANIALLTGQRELQRKNWLMALDELVKAETLDPDRALGATPVLGQMQAQVGLKRPADAVRTARRLLKRNLKEVDVVPALLYGAELAERAGDTRNARELWSRLLEAPAERAKARAALERLHRQEAVRSRAANAEADAEAAAEAADPPAAAAPAKE